MKKLLVIVLALAMVFSMAACGADNQEIKIGVIVADDTGSEALAFRSYYEDYIQNAYENVTFMYSTKCENAAQEADAINNFIANNCKAVISFSSSDRPAQIELCQQNKVYYAVATGTLTQEEYETYKSYEYYVGAIGPDNMTEYQAGYDMVKYYTDQGKTSFAMFGGAAPYYVEMHIYRAAGMLAAMAEAGGSNYKGATGMDIIGMIYADNCEISPCEMGSISLKAYVGGYNFDDAWFGALGAAANSGAEVCLAVGSGETAFSGFVPEGVTYGDIDAYTETNASYFSAGKLSYMAGKFSSSIGPIFIATVSAVQGKPIRTGEGYALALSQGYWVATDMDTFNAYLASSASATAPAYTKEILDKYIGASYADFSAFVAQYSFDEISSLSK